jgi:hypothetical protein
MHINPSSLGKAALNPILLRFFPNYSSQLALLKENFDHQLILQGRALALQNADRAPLKSLEDAEFKVFSQYGEDGILQYLIREAGLTRDEQIFVEFGVQNYQESNTRYLLQGDQWKGMIIDGSAASIDLVTKSQLYWRHDLTAVAAWIDCDNINDILLDSGFKGPIGLLSIDVDGNDYWIWKKIQVVDPVIVVVEWNSVFGPRHAVSIPYSPSFDRLSAHFSCLYWGASMAAFERLAIQKGYSLIGSNKVGNNLFFVRNDRLGRLRSCSTAEVYVESRFRDSRDPRGRLNFLSGRSRYEQIKDLDVIDLHTNQTTTLAKLDASW